MGGVGGGNGAVKGAYAASLHDKWFRSQSKLAMVDASSANAVWHQHDAKFDALETEQTAG
jgi:hypothetical protein